MSSCLWATEAARRKRKPLFPGSARFNAAELHHGVQKTHHGVTSIEELISPLVSDFNLLIDLLNDGNKEKMLLLAESMESTKLESAPVESSVDESSSRLWSAGGSATPDMTTVKTERFENTLLLAEAIRSEIGEEFQKNSNSQRVSMDVQVKKETAKPEEAEEFFEEAEQESPEKNHAEQEPAEEDEIEPENHDDEVNGNIVEEDLLLKTVHTSPEKTTKPVLPALLNRLSELEIRDEPDIEDSANHTHGEEHEELKSPAQLTSDKLYHSDERPKEQKSVRVKVEDSDSEVSDTSFQAISSAIRKSFAGKVSMGQSEHALLNSPGLARKSTGNYRRSSGKNLVSIKRESEETRSRDSGPSLTTKPALTAGNRISKRTSVFVSLPSREPISYLSNKRQSIKVKTEEPDNAPRKSTVNLALSKAANLEPSQPSKIPVDNSNGRRAAMVRNGTSESGSIPKADRSSTKNQNSKLHSSAAGASSTHRASSRSPTKHSSPLYAASMRSKSKPGSSQGSRTTNLGSPQHSPPRLSTKESKPSSRSRSPVKALHKTTRSPQRTPALQARSSLRASRATSPTRVPQLSSAPSSRSPTRYGNREINDTEPGRYSVATSTSASTPGEKKYSEGNQKAPSSTGLVKSGQQSVKEKRSQNKFLTTTLNPQNPPKFNPVKTKIKNPSPIKRFLDTDPEKERLELKERRLRMNELAVNKVVLPPLVSDGGDRTKLTATQGRRSPPRKRAPSPVKREPLPSRDEARISAKLRKTGEAESVSLSRRRAAVGNAQPLPEAARGRFVRERHKEQPKVEEKRTPIRGPSSGRSAKTPIRVGASGSPGIRGDALPEIPSDDDSLRKQKYFKTWANTPELQKLIQSNQKLNPSEIFGEVSDLRMDEVFESTSGDKK